MKNDFLMFSLFSLSILCVISTIFINPYLFFANMMVSVLLTGISYLIVWLTGKSKNEQ